MKITPAYTLIEILVGITIIGLIFGFGYVNFRDFSRRQELAGVSKQIKGDLRLAQEQALSGKKPESCTDLLNGYEFLVVDDGNYSVLADCNKDNPATTVKTVSLPTDLSISNPLPNPIYFKALGQGTNIVEAGSITLTLSQFGTNNQSIITVTAGGEIK